MRRDDKLIMILSIDLLQNNNIFNLMQGENFIKTQEGDQEDIKIQKYTLNQAQKLTQLDEEQRERYVSPANNLPNRHYSLDPDCIGGWKPKPANKKKYLNVFPIRYDEEIVDILLKQLVKYKQKYNEAVTYLGPRKTNTLQLHMGRQYPNPYKKQNSSEILWQNRPGRIGISSQPQLRSSFLHFNSDFQGGNLDAVIQRGSDQFDLFMRVDSNTRGHTNWFFFQIKNQAFIGTITFNICNFRRPFSLYRRGLKPYVWTKQRSSQGWAQIKESVKYEKQKLRYPFLQQKLEQRTDQKLSAFYCLSFTFKFETPHDTTKMAYSPPFLYSQLDPMIKELENFQLLPPLKSLSGLAIPILKITNQQIDENNKKVSLITARIHPGESNSSFVVQGFLQFVCSNDPLAKEIRSKYILYVIPMANPDGVVAGNYRTSLFGKDLNRTFNQMRKFAFPQIYYLLKFAQELKKTHKKRFCIYLDLHGHSVKKNVFMYGPDYSIQDQNYEISRQLPRILGNLTNYFRYYSCTFKIPEAKMSTGRAVFNRELKIPYTYTMQSSNGCYYDFSAHIEVPFNIEKWKQMGAFLAKGLNQLRLERLPRIARTYTQKLTKKNHQIDEEQINKQEGEGQEDSDGEPNDQDLPEQILMQVQKAVKGEITQESIKSATHIQSQVIPKPKKSKKKVQTRIQDYMKSLKPSQVNELKPSVSKQYISFHAPERRVVNFPQIKPGDIFINRQNRHEKQDISIQIRFKKNDSQHSKHERIQRHNMSANSKQDMSNSSVVPKKQLNFTELMKRYKFNF